MYAARSCSLMLRKENSNKENPMTRKKLALFICSSDQQGHYFHKKISRKNILITKHRGNEDKTQ